MNETTLAATPEQPAAPAKLAARTIGLSISDSPDLKRLGFGPEHLQDAMIEFARFFLASGATLAYGGDLRKGGFTRMLFELAETHKRNSDKPSYQRIVNFLAWPIHLDLREDEQAKHKQIVDFRRCQIPVDLGIDQQTPLPPDTPEHRYIWARCLTAMREEINGFVNARLLMGGQLKGYKGKYPGLAEEAYLALRDSKPLFLVGGFGGCTAAVIEAIQGKQPEALSEKFQLEDANYRELFELYNERVTADPNTGQQPIDYGELVQFFNAKGIAGLNNGLTEEENRRLLTTPLVPGF